MLLLITNPVCPECDRFKAALKREGIKYDEFVIGDPPRNEASDVWGEAMKAGIMSFPIIGEMDGQRVVRVGRPHPKGSIQWL